VCPEWLWAHQSPVYSTRFLSLGQWYQKGKLITDLHPVPRLLSSISFKRNAYLSKDMFLFYLFPTCVSSFFLISLPSRSSPFLRVLLSVFLSSFHLSFLPSSSTSPFWLIVYLTLAYRAYVTRQDRNIEFSLVLLTASYTTAKEVSFVSWSRSGFDCSFWKCRKLRRTKRIVFSFLMSRLSIETVRRMQQTLHLKVLHTEIVCIGVKLGLSY
jgi:hypothetical protein